MRKQATYGGKMWLRVTLLAMCWGNGYVLGGTLKAYPSDIHDIMDAPLEGATCVTMVGVRNGSFSSKVVVEGAAPGFKATVSDLKQGPHTIPATRIAIRYGAPWKKGDEKRSASFKFVLQGGGNPPGFDLLFPAPPAAPAALQTVWLTIDIPQDAAAGTYEGVLSIDVGGSLRLPVKLEVVNWALPDTQNYRTWMEMLQSPDTLAMEYGVPMWSDKHWAAIAQSFDMIAKTGSRVLYIPLVAHTNYGNEETMVRWVKKGSGYEYDFSIMEKYLDVAEKHMGRPKIVVLYAWEIYMKAVEDKRVNVSKEDLGTNKGDLAEVWKLRGKGNVVTVVDGGKVAAVDIGKYSDLAVRAKWKVVWDELRARLEKRGLWKVAMIGMINDHWPTEEEITVLNELSGGRPWTSTSHHAKWVFTSNNEVSGAKVGYTATALDFQYVINPAKERFYGWKKPLLHGTYWRWGTWNAASPSWIRQEPEANITGNQRGMCRVGGDFWIAIKDKTGKRLYGTVGTAGDRYPESFWHSLNIGSYLLGPGPDGPVGTTRFELLKEGVEECETRIFLESALTEAKLKNKLGTDLAKRAQEVLDERQLALWKSRGVSDAELQNLGALKEYRQILTMIGVRNAKWDISVGHKWFLTSNWMERSHKLYAMAAEVEVKLGSQATTAR